MQKKIRVKCGRVVRGLLIAAALVFALPAFAAAQSPEASEAPSTFDNMPGVIILLIPLAIGAALYLSYKLGRTDEEAGPRREGAVSRALARDQQEAERLAGKPES